MLHGKVPLVRYRRLYGAGPGQHGRPDERIARRRRSGTESGRGIESGAGSHVTGFNLGWSKRRVLGEAQVGSRTFQIRRDGEGAANHGLAAECLRIPGKADARLEVQQTVVGFVETITEAIRPYCSGGHRSIAGELQLAGLDIDADLAIVEFSPGSTSFITQTDVQGKVAGNAPVVLGKAGKEPVALTPAA